MIERKPIMASIGYFFFAFIIFYSLFHSSQQSKIQVKQQNNLTELLNDNKNEIIAFLESKLNNMTQNSTKDKPKFYNPAIYDYGEIVSLIITFFYSFPPITIVLLLCLSSWLTFSHFQCKIGAIVSFSVFALIFCICFQIVIYDDTSGPFLNSLKHLGCFYPIYFFLFNYVIVPNMPNTADQTMGMIGKINYYLWTIPYNFFRLWLVKEVLELNSKMWFIFFIRRVLAELRVWGCSSESLAKQLTMFHLCDIVHKADDQLFKWQWDVLYIMLQVLGFQRAFDEIFKDITKKDTTKKDTTTTPAVPPPPAVPPGDGDGTQ